MTPEQAQWLVQAGAWVILLFENATIFAIGAREVWVWGATFRRSLEREALLRAENAELRKSVEAGVEAQKTMSADFVSGLKGQADLFTAALRDQTGAFDKSIEHLDDKIDQLSGIVIHELGIFRGDRPAPVRSTPPKRGGGRA